MKKIGFAIIIVLAFSLNALAQQNSFQTVNIMEDFWKFWEKAEKSDLKTQVKLFREIVIEPHKEIYGGFTGERSDEDLEGYLKIVPKLIPRLKKINAKLGEELPKHKATFVKTFTDMNWQGKVVFMPNFGVTDSGTGSLNGTQYLIFGVDTIAAQYGENADFAVLLHHELFHLYHSQKHKEWENKSRSENEIPLYWLVWSEGLATYVSKRLNPEASLEQVFITKNLEQDTRANLPFLAKKIRDNLDSTSPEIWQPFMANDEMNKEIPPRSGYSIGYFIAEELGKKLSLKQLSELKGNDLKKKMKKILLKLEKEKAIAKTK